MSLYLIPYTLQCIPVMQLWYHNFVVERVCRFFSDYNSLTDLDRKGVDLPVNGGEEEEAEEETIAIVADDSYSSENAFNNSRSGCVIDEIEKKTDKRGVGGIGGSSHMILSFLSFVP